MASEAPGVNLFLSWGVIQWVIGGVVSGTLGAALWIFTVGKKVEWLSAKVEELSERVDKLSVDMREMDRKVDDRYTELELGRQQLKLELLSKMADIATREFVNAALTQQMTRIEANLDKQTSRIDRLLAAKLLGDKD